MDDPNDTDDGILPFIALMLLLAFYGLIVFLIFAGLIWLGRR